MLTSDEFPVTVFKIYDLEEAWSWTCGVCPEEGGEYELASHAGTVALAHQELHELQRLYAPTMAG